MSQPTPYSRQFDFTGHSSSRPNTPLPGVQVDAELNAVRAALNHALTNLALIQRDDTGLANGLVGIDQLSAVVQAMLAGGGFTVRGNWAAATAYLRGDIVSDSGKVYLVITDHNSSASLAADIASGYVSSALFEPHALLDYIDDLAAATGAGLVGSTGGITVQAALDLKAALASPAFTGTPAAPTAALGTDTTQIATTAFVQDAVQALLDAAPGTLDTLNELAAALGDDANFAATMTTALAAKTASADLAASGGSALVGFLQSGSGAVARTVQDKLRDDISPKEFGAAGDGVTNDDAEFTALEAVYTGRDIDLQGLTYLVTAEPTGNRYANGFFKISSETYRRSRGPGRNFCWNGNFDIWQRGTSFTSFASRNGVADGWTFARSSFAAGSTVAQQQGSRTSNYCIRVQRDSGNTGTEPLTLVFNMGQADSRPLIGRRVTLSFRARAGADFSSASSLLTAQLKSTDSASELSITAANGTYGSGDTTSGGTSVTLTTSWQTFTLSATIATDKKQVALRFTYAPVGTAGAADYFEIEEVKEELGGVATEFIPEDLAYATAKAEEQYFKTYQIDVQPGALSYLGALNMRARGTEATAAVTMPCPFKTRMRATPTVTLYSPQTGASGKMTDGSSDINATTNQIGTHGVMVWNNAATTSGQVYYVHVVAEAKL